MLRCLFSSLLWMTLVSTQTLAIVPACARSAIESDIRGSGCAIDDVPCICASENLKFAFDSANDVCSKDDQKTLRGVFDILCNDDGALEIRDTPDGDDEGGDIPSPTMTSQDTDQDSLEKPVISPAPIAVPEDTDQAALEAPVPAPVPTTPPENINVNQAALDDTATAPPIVASSSPDQTPFPAPPTAIAPPKTPLPTSATSLATDTREFLHPSSSPAEDSSMVITSTQQAAGHDGDPNGLTSATPGSPGPEDTGLLSANATDNSSGGGGQSEATGQATEEVAVSFAALVVAVAVLTWAFAEF